MKTRSAAETTMNGAANKNAEDAITCAMLTRHEISPGVSRHMFTEIDDAAWESQRNAWEPIP